jgi:Leucine-rich repeat (LRR) protein
MKINPLKWVKPDEDYLMRYIFSLLLCLSLTSFALAQENEQTPYEIALQRIEEAEASGASSLSLYNLDLIGLPPEIGNLTRLQSLNLSYNQLSSLPGEIGNLSNLCELVIRENLFESIPLEIYPLKHLAIIGECADTLELYIDDYLLETLPDEVVAGGTSAILAYLENEAWWHLQRLIAGGAGAIGLLSAIVLGWRWKNRRGKAKRKIAE